MTKFHTLVETLKDEKQHDAVDKSTSEQLHVREE